MSDGELKILSIPDDVVVKIPLGFRVIHYKALPSKGDSNGHIWIESYHGKSYPGGLLHKPISRI